MSDFLKKYKVFLTLFLIVLFGAFLRFYNISSVPVSLYWDEVASAYNAYSIAQSGKDEYGTSYPLLFRSFEDYKTPANIYLTSVIVKFLGLSEFTTRFTSALFGSLSVLISFFLVSELLKKQKFKDKKINIPTIALITSFLFEANVGLFFLLTGILFLLRTINRVNYRDIIFSAIFLGISIYFYRSIQLFLPLFLLGFFIIFRKNILDKSNLKIFLAGAMIFSAIALPFVPSTISREGLTRQRQTNFVSNALDEVYKTSVKIHESKNRILGNIIYNRRIVYARLFVQNYVSHFTPKFLVEEGDVNPRHRVKGMGVFYHFEIPFLIAGLIFLFKIDRKIRSLIILWILIAPLPAALAYPTPHALRSLNMLPMLQLLTAMGVVYLYSLTSPKLRRIFVVSLAIIITAFFIRYIYQYHFVFKYQKSAEWADGYKQLTQYVFRVEDKYDKVVISGHYWQPYIYFLFFKQYNPQLFQKYGSKSSFDKYIFGGTSWDMKGRELGDQDLVKLSGTRNILIAFSPIEYELQKENVRKISEIRNHNNEIVFIMASLR